MAWMNHSATALRRGVIGFGLMLTFLSVGCASWSGVREVEFDAKTGQGYVAMPENTNDFPFYYRDTAKNMLRERYGELAYMSDLAVPITTPTSTGILGRDEKTNTSVSVQAKGEKKEVKVAFMAPTTRVTQQTVIPANGEQQVGPQGQFNGGRNPQMQNLDVRPQNGSGLGAPRDANQGRMPGFGGPGGTEVERAGGAIRNPGDVRQADFNQPVGGNNGGLQPLR